MCLIEEDKSIKLLASCATTANNELKIYTNTIRVKKARESTLEFLLINHPLDCPICDQGGECDLQDQTMVFGSDSGRFYEYKRNVQNKNLGLYIRTSMNRCIHCTRCVRFNNEIGNDSKLGLLGRGNQMEIGTYIFKENITNELSGNLIDLCPVGALTSKLTAFKARPWELDQFESVDIFDPLLPGIRIDVQGTQLIRVLPKIDKYLNDDWLTNKSRFLLLSFSNNSNSFIKQPFIKIKNKFLSVQDSKLIAVSWQAAFGYFKIKLIRLLQQQIKLKLGYFNFLGWFGEGNDLLTCYSFYIFLNSFGSPNIYIENSVNYQISNDLRNQYILSAPILTNVSISKTVFFIIYINLRAITPLLNFKLQQLKKHNSLTNLIYWGKNFKNNSLMLNSGTNQIQWMKNFSGKTWLNHYFLFKTTHFIFNQNLIHNYNNFLFFLDKIQKHYLHKTGNLSYNVVYYTTTLINLFELNFFNTLHTFNNIQLNKNWINKFVYYFSNSQRKENNMINKVVNKSNTFIVDNQQYNKKFNNDSNIIFPNKNFFERSTLHFNIEGKLKQIQPIKINTNFKSRSDWEIISLLLIYFNTDAKINKNNPNGMLIKKQQLILDLLKLSPFINIPKKQNLTLYTKNVKTKIFFKKLFKIYYENCFIGNWKTQTWKISKNFQIKEFSKEITPLNIKNQNLNLLYNYNY